MSRANGFHFLSQQLTPLTEHSCVRLLTLDKVSWELGINTLPGATSFGSGSLVSEQGRGPSASFYYLQLVQCIWENAEQIILPSLAPLTPLTPEGWEVFVAILISQVQRGLRYVSILSSLLSFCILSRKNQGLNGAYSKGNQERNLVQLWLNPNPLLPHWKASADQCWR